jgi:SSS family solute:Na+ symporter
MIFGLPQGPAQFLEIAIEHRKFSLGSLGMSLAEPTFWVVLVYGTAINLQNFGIDQNYVQRYLAPKSDREARKSVWIGGLLYVPVSVIFFVIGTGLFVFYKVHPDLLAPEYRDPSKSDSVFPYFIISQLPPGITGLLIASIFAAAMSTIATSLNSSATLLMRDYYQRYINPKATERQSVIVLYLGTLLWGVGGTFIALGMAKVGGSALDIWWKWSGILAGGMLGLFLLGFISRRPGNPAAVTGVICGVLIILWMTLSPAWTGRLESLRSPFHSFMTIVFGTLVILLVGLLITATRSKNSSTSR